MVVTRGAADFAAALFADEPSPMSYASEKREEILAADEVIEKLPVRPAAVEIVPVGRMFAE